MAEFTIRKAQPGDAGLVLYFIKKLAEYEKMLDEVEATEEILHRSLFERHAANAIIAEEDGKAIGFALYFYNFSTFLGKPGLYIEDVFILPEYRGKGYGTQIFRHLANVAREEGCGRMEWICLDWNEPSLRFYRNMGAVPMEEWTVQRLTEDKLRDVAMGK